MKFAHLADCHVGAWREPKLRDLTIHAFIQAIDSCIKEQVDFVLICGDLFHTALPSIDGVKAVFKQLTRLKANGIPLYFITGSHDYSPTGKTMLDVIEEADLGTNVFRGTVEEGALSLTWTIDEKTGAKLTGILGRANQLDSSIYTHVDRAALEETKGDTIFLFHTSLAELKTNGSSFDSAPLSMLPKNLTYYAGGHVHQRVDTVIDGRHIVYPGPLFPASFSELEDLGHGSFCIVDSWKVRRIPIHTKTVQKMHLDCTALTPMHIVDHIKAQAVDTKDAIVLLRLYGEITGKLSDIPWKQVSEELKDAYVVLRNTVELTSPEMQKNMIATGSLADIEERVISEHKVDPHLVRELMRALSSEKQDGEKQQAYEERVVIAAQAATKQRAFHARPD